jgi:hypothetical protein
VGFLAPLAFMIRRCTISGVFGGGGGGEGGDGGGGDRIPRFRNWSNSLHMLRLIGGILRLVSFSRRFSPRRDSW